MKTEIVVAVAAVPAGMFVPHTLHHSREQTEVPKLAESEVDSTRQIRDRLERYPGHAPLMERLHISAARLHMLGAGGLRPLRIAHCAGPQSLQIKLTSGFESRPVL